MYSILVSIIQEIHAVLVYQVLACIHFMYTFYVYQVFIGYWICIRKYWVTWLEISVRTCEHRYQAKEPNIFVYRFNNLIIICGMQIYQN